MSSFTESVVVRRKSVEDQYYSVQHDFRYYIGEVGSKSYVDVHKGFLTDLASIPTLISWLIPKRGNHDASAVLHDFLYLFRPQINGIRPNRKTCDKIFREALQISGASKLKTWAMYRGVRIGGGSTWNNYRRAEMQRPV